MVYAFVQIRKLTGRDNASYSYPRLKFFCDWAVHGGLAGTEAQRVLVELDDILKNLRGRQIWKVDCKGKVSGFLSHFTLRTEFARFFEHVGVDQVWTKGDGYAWFTMSKLYTEIVRDCPLEINRRGYDFPYLAKLAITNREPWPPIADANVGQEHIGWTWTFTLSDGRTFELGHSSSFGRGLTSPIA